MSYHFHSSLYRITKAVRIQPCHFWVSKKRLSYFLATFPENHWFWPVWMYYERGGCALIASLCLRGLGHAIALGYVTMASFLCTQYDVSFSHLRSAVGVSFDMKKACRRRTVPLFKKLWDIIFFLGTITFWAVSRDNLRGQKSLGPLKMSLETAQKFIVPQKKNYVPQFLKQRDINS